MISWRSFNIWANVAAPVGLWRCLFKTFKFSYPWHYASMLSNEVSADPHIYKEWINIHNPFHYCGDFCRWESTQSYPSSSLALTDWCLALLNVPESLNDKLDGKTNFDVSPSPLEVKMLPPLPGSTTMCLAKILLTFIFLMTVLIQFLTI